MLNHPIARLKTYNGLKVMGHKNMKRTKYSKLSLFFLFFIMQKFFDLIKWN